MKRLIGWSVAVFAATAVLPARAEVPTVPGCEVYVIEERTISLCDGWSFVRTEDETIASENGELFRVEGFDDISEIPGLPDTEEYFVPLGKGQIFEDGTYTLAE